MSCFDSQVKPNNRFMEVICRRRWFSFIVAALLVVSGMACTSMGSIEPLDVTLANLNITKVTIFETTLVAKLRITNPNPEAFTIEGASFKLYLEDKKVGTGTTSEVFTVERLDSYVVDTMFHVNNASALLRLKDIFEAKEVSYGLRGSLFTQGAFGTKKIKIEKMGRVDLTGTIPTQTDTADPFADAPPSG